MRQVESFGSVKAISLNRDECVQHLRQVAGEALKAFPELLEVRLFGSLATGTYTGTSDVDLLLRVRTLSGNPVEAMKPYYFFFSRRLNVGLDMLLFGPTVPKEMQALFQESVVLAARRAQGKSYPSG